MSHHVLAPQAADDILNIYLFGHDTFGARQADYYQDELKRAFQRLADFPKLGRLRDEIDPAVRTQPTGSHVIIYEETASGVTILRVRHGHEDWTGDPLGYDL